MSVTEPYDEGWKHRVLTRIRRSDCVLATVSANSQTSSGQQWEIASAQSETRPLRGIWAYRDDRTNLVSVNTMVWPWPNIAALIDTL